MPAPAHRRPAALTLAEARAIVTNPQAALYTHDLRRREAWLKMGDARTARLRRIALRALPPTSGDAA